MKGWLAILFCAVVLLSSSSHAQEIKSFSSDSAAFFKELTILLETADKKRAKSIVKEFEPIWGGGIYTEEQREAIYKATNFMLKKKMRPFPDFSSYIGALIGFASNEIDQQSFYEWQKCVERLITSKNKRKLSQYLKFCRDLLESGIIYKSASTNWKIRGGSYQFIYDQEPIVVFDTTDLLCLAKGDSAVIYRTIGTCYPIASRGALWEGRKGIVTWERAGFSRDSIYAKLNRYVVKLKSPSYTADSVVFNNAFFFDYPLKGSIEEKVLANVNEDRASYPRFRSYNKRLRISDLTEGVDFEGVFLQKGAKFIGAGDEEKSATLTFYNREGKFMKLSSKAFSINPKSVVSQNAAASVYFEGDSIIHPSVKVRLKLNARSLVLVRNEKGAGQSPFFNTFHQLDMYFEALYWGLDNAYMEMRPIEGNTDQDASFESANLFDERDYDRMQGLGYIHPYTQIKACTKKIGLREFYVSELASCMGISASQLAPMLLDFSNKGLIYYNFENQYVEVKERLFHQVASKSKKADYDILRFSSSVTKDNNARLDLENFDLQISGVERIFLSDSQRVYVYPKYGEVVVRKNRNFQFDGVAVAGKFEFFGSNFSFDYDSFKIAMPTIDSLRLYTYKKRKNEFEKRQAVRVRSTVESLKGSLEIDHPRNKSGKQSLSQYPIFHNVQQSYVHYQKSYIFNGVYPREKFIFVIDPFDFDSLDNFPQSSLRLAGEMTTAGIFPQFREELSIQGDYSLGFIRPTPADGFPVYGGKGMYYKAISLSNRGLRGSGRLTYLNATLASRDFVFFPDSMNTLANEVYLEEQPSGVEFPPVTGEKIAVHWRPYRDLMRMTSTFKGFAMYDEISNLQGTLLLQPSGLEGFGKYNIGDAQIESKKFKFKFTDLNADTADFRLKSNNADNLLAFDTKNFNAHIDYKERKGEFVSNGGGSLIDFPINQYIAYMNKFIWYMDNNDIELSATTKNALTAQSDLQLEGSKFVSTHPDQDSLSFYSAAARYDLSTNIITAKKVKFMQVADAMIYPDSGLVVVEPKAKMRTLKNAKVVANFITQFYKIYNATIKVLARKNYKGVGDVDYVDANKKVQTIHLDELKVDTTSQTYGKGFVLRKDDFTLSPNFDFFGEVELFASNPNFTFTGHTRMKYNCFSASPTWVKFSTEVDPEEIYIPVDTSIAGEDNQPLYAGVMMGSDSSGMYSTFFDKKKAQGDEYVSQAQGFLFYEKRSKEYRISSLQKLNQFSLPGNYVSLSTKTCTQYGEGTLNLGVDLGQPQVSPVGNITHELVKDSVGLSVMLLLDFFFEESALTKMGKALKGLDTLEAVSFDRPEYEKGLQEILGKSAADKLISQVSLYGSFKKFPDELNKPIFLTDVKLRWDKETASYISEGKIGLGSVLKQQINKYFKGHLKITKKRSGNSLDLYLEVDENNWYYFNYQRNFMQAFSSNLEFNSAITEVKADKRKLKYAKGKPPITFMISSKRKKDIFLRKMNPEDTE